MEEVLDAFVRDIERFTQDDLDAITHKVVSSEISADGFWVKFSVSLDYPCAAEVINMLASRHPNLSRKYSEGYEVFQDDRMAGEDAVGLKELQRYGLKASQRLGLGEEEE